MHLLCKLLLLLAVFLVLHAQAATTTIGGGVPTMPGDHDEVTSPEPLSSEDTRVIPRRERQERRQQRQAKRRLAEARRSNRERNRRQREELRRQRQIQGRRGEGAPIGEQQTVELSWLTANLSSLWQTVRRIETTLGDIIQEDHPSPLSVPAECDLEDVDQSECPLGDAMCRQTPLDEPCSGLGTCCCGECQCQMPNFGFYCECSNESCLSHEGQECGSHGSCVCGWCHCNIGYEGEACECPTSTDNCTDPHNGQVCNNYGQCQCGKCNCQNGNFGRYCEETTYSAGLCEELKPCVLCKAYGKTMPQCSMCSHVTMRRVQHLEPSNKVCRMVHSGCLLQYSYLSAPEGQYDVMVPEDTVC